MHKKENRPVVLCAPNASEMNTACVDNWINQDRNVSVLSDTILVQTEISKASTTVDQLV